MSIEPKVKDPSFSHEEKMEAKFLHIDDWLDQPTMYKDEAYAKFVLDYKRMPAWKQGAYHEYMKDHKLFCTYKGKRYRVTGASRLGDVWLNKDFEQEFGYDYRIEVTACSEWGSKP